MEPTTLNSWQALILGMIQGVSEFLPISSSAHIIVFSEWLQGQTLPLPLNVGLHTGTLLAIIAYFWRDLRDLLQSALRPKPWKQYWEDNQLAFLLVIGTIPAAVIGLLFKDLIELYFHHGSSVILPLIIVGWLIWAVDRFAKVDLSIARLGLGRAFMIGVGQALALIPGVSRSGSTIMLGRFLGLDRTSAARFSFLLGIPAMVGATILESKEIVLSLGDSNFYWGFAGSLLVGLLTIHFFLRLITKINFLVFAIYRTLLAILIFAIL